MVDLTLGKEYPILEGYVFVRAGVQPRAEVFMCLVMYELDGNIYERVK